jgi:cytochrome c oxidase subunit 2
MPVSRRTKRGLAVIVGLLLSSILFAACSEPASILNVAGPIANDERNLFYIIVAVAVIVFVGVEGALIYSIVRFRSRPNTPNPRQLHGDMRLELLWTVIPSIFLLIILAFTISTLIQVSPEAEPTTGPKINVTAIGHQWWWSFYYNDYGFETADSLVIPTNTTIHVDLFSNNVIHSFWVPALTGKTDVVPGHNNKKWFIANTAGTYPGLCAEYCGTQHANMKFNVVAESNDAFQSWVHTQEQPAINPTADRNPYSATDGKSVFLNNCVSCHGIVGDNLKSYPDTPVDCNGANDPTADCLIGPNLTHFGSRDLIAGGVLENDPSGCADTASPDLYQTCGLAQWLQNTQKYKPGNDMVVNLTDAQIRDLVAYLETLK